MTNVGKLCILFGGMGEDNDNVTIYNETFAIDASANDIPCTFLQCEGKAPEGRWRHTATCIGDSCMLVFGGIGSNNKRFDDCWKLDISGDSPVWTLQPTAGQRPSPRAHHSANLWKEHLVVFGGYGGHGQRRTYFNDVHLLNLQGGEDGALEWVQVQTGGNPPAPRGNHTASVMAVPASSGPKMLMVMGGRDYSTFFDDIHFLVRAHTTLSSASPAPHLVRIDAEVWNRIWRKWSGRRFQTFPTRQFPTGLQITPPWPSNLFRTTRCLSSADRYCFSFCVERKVDLFLSRLETRTRELTGSTSTT